VGSVVAEREAHPTADDAAPQPSRSLLTIGAVTTVVVVLDQLTKWWALEALTDPTRVIDLVWTLRLRVIYNTGTAFSLTSDSGPIVSVIALVVVAFLLWSGRRQRSPWVLAAYGLVVGGTFGNMIDRLFRDGNDGLLGGAVIDFVDLQWFPVFNLADSALTVGIGLLLVVGFFTDALDDPPEDDTGA
jgi:signal peptidase II